MLLWLLVLIISIWIALNKMNQFQILFYFIKFVAYADDNTYCSLDNIEEFAHSYFSNGVIQASSDLHRHVEVMASS